MIKDIVVNLSVGKPKDVAGEFAVSAAALFGAHLSAVAFAYDTPVGQSISDVVNREIIQKWRADRQVEAERAEKAVLEKARIANVACDVRLFRDLPTEAAQVFAATARNYDLAILAQAQHKDDAAEAMAIEATLFSSGRPLLVVPYIHQTGLRLDRVTVCWDGSRSAARAVGDALPLLKKSGKVEVVTVHTKERRNELPGAQIAEHLARHGLNVELKQLVAPDTDTASVILSHAAGSAVDLVVMGGYGHSRFREFVLGGMTRSMLGSMTVPVLMSH
jgi:nucleotide-binding universal stress UspA family protein